MSSLITRKKREKNFTVIQNDIITDNSISLQARMVLIYILHLPDDWVLRSCHIMKALDIGRTALDNHFKDLQKVGYMVKGSPKKGVGGRFEGYDYTVFENKEEGVLFSRHSGFVNPVKQNTEKKPLIKTNDTNTNTTNTPISPKGDFGENLLDIEAPIDLDDVVSDICRVHLATIKTELKRDAVFRRGRQIKKLFDNGYEKTDILKSIVNISKDEWQKKNRYPALALNQLFTDKTIQRFKN